MSDQTRLAQLRDDIADHCVAIEDLFRVPVKVTCIVRRVGNPEGDVLVTSDDLDEAIAVINRSKARDALATIGTVDAVLGCSE